MLITLVINHLLQMNSTLILTCRAYIDSGQAKIGKSCVSTPSIDITFCYFFNLVSTIVSRFF